MRSLLGTVLNRGAVPHTGRSGGGLRLPMMGRNDAESQMRAMGSVSTLFSIVNRTSNATSQVDWRLWRKKTDGRRRTATGEADQRTEITSHAALDLWNKPNPFMTRQYLVEATQQHIDLTGEGCLVVVRDERVRQIPLELWPVRPDRIAPIPHRDKFIAGYVYCAPDGENVPLATDEVIKIKMPNPLDPYSGLGAVQAAMVDLHSARASAEWNRNFFLNDATPGGIIAVDNKLDDDEFDQMLERWREAHQGVNNAHRVAIIEAGKWVPTAFSQKDMQFKELRDLSRELIREAFGIHGHMLGNSQDVNKANAEAGEVSFARWLVKPRVERFKQALNSMLLPMFGSTADGMEFDHDRVVPEDREADDRERTSKTEAWATLVTAGAAPDDAADVVGLPRMTFVGPPAAPAPAEA